MKSTQNVLLTERKVCKISSVVFAAQPYPIGIIERLQRAANSAYDNTEACLKPFLDILYNCGHCIVGPFIPILPCSRTRSFRVFIELFGHYKKWKLYWHRPQEWKETAKHEHNWGFFRIARMQLHETIRNKTHEETHKNKQKTRHDKPNSGQRAPATSGSTFMCLLSEIQMFLLSEVRS